MKLRAQVEEFVNNIRREEQPYYRVKAMVDNVLRRQKQDAGVPLIGMVQLRHYLLASALLLRLELAILSSVITLKRSSLAMARSRHNTDHMDFVVDLEANRKDCVQLTLSAVEGLQPRQQAEGHLLFARYAALEASVVHCSRGRDPPKGINIRVPPLDDLREKGLAHLDQAKALCKEYAGTTAGLQSEVDATRKMLQSEFYEPVSGDERREILQAMATEFSGTGHWYTCANGHPFTIGECGGPMEEARCPQCGAAIGGHHHVMVGGAQRAEELEREAAALGGRMRGLDLD